MSVKITPEGSAQQLPCCKTQRRLLAFTIVMLFASFSITTTRAEDLETKCNDDAKKFIARQFADPPGSPRSIKHVAHYNRRLGVCLVSVTFTNKSMVMTKDGLKEVISPQVMQGLINVGDSRELAHYLSSNANAAPMGCRVQSRQGQNSNCGSLAEYEAFVDGAMRE
ncbi:MAG: hypothetical protein Q7J42_17605 [Sulfuritalea sp.]|nr:hypothetical protein [Sulfuritalea sp.]